MIMIMIKYRVKAIIAFVNPIKVLVYNYKTNYMENIMIVTKLIIN